MIKKFSKYVVVFFSLILFLSPNGYTAEIKKIAIFPFEAHSKEDIGYIQGGIGSLLPPRVAIQGKISVLDRNLVSAEFTKSGEGKTVQEKLPVAKKLDADFILSGSITKIGSNVSVDTVLVDVAEPSNQFQLFIQSEDFDSIIPELNKLAQRIKDIVVDDPDFVESVPAKRYDEPISEPDSVQEAYRDEPSLSIPKKPVVRQVEPVFNSVPVMRFTTKGVPAVVMASGDINGNGNKEILIANRREIFVYETSADGFIQTGSIKFPVGSYIIALDCGDFRQNGVDEIYVTSFKGRFPNSYVAEYTDEEYKILLSGEKYFFRVIIDDEGEKTLLGQSALGSTPFSGTVSRLFWKEDGLIQRDEVSIPRDLGIYNFSKADIDGDGTRDLMAFHKAFLAGGEKLTLFSYTGRVKWVDPEKLGGSTNTFTVSYIGDDAEKEMAVPVRIICEDFNGDGKVNVVVAKNSTGKKGVLDFLTSYSEGEVLSLYWDGIDFLSNWTSGQLGGYIADYIAEDIDSDGNKELVILSVTTPDFFGKSENTVTVFKQR